MNRIILIGNGFDLAHGLKTGYKDFIDDFWRRKVEEIKKVSHLSEFGEKDEFVYLSTDTQRLSHIVDTGLKIQSLKDFEAAIENFEKSVYQPKIEFTIKNAFLEYISKLSSESTWLDIEDAYHKTLNAIAKGLVGNIGFLSRYSVEDLHKDFENVKKALEKYLIRVMEKNVEPIEGVLRMIDSSIYFDDFTSKGKTAIQTDIMLEIEHSNRLKDFKKGLKEKYEDLNSFFSYKTQTEEEFYKKEIWEALEDDVEWLRRIPGKRLFLNFNYTKLEELYGDYSEDYKREDQVIHIHGELNNPNNPIIFGYGDELCDEYKELEKLNKNEYLENIKSIKYLETRNYKDLLSFVDSEEYQIFVFGHSCGNSDRTLLNTLFEHQNCVSIKVFYHKDEEKGTDNYSDVVRNISRNFEEKKALREKVVNKEFSVPLPQAAK